MKRRDEVCARCDDFTIASYPELAERGEGYCKGFERAVAWDESCVVFRRDPNTGPRERWIKLQRERTEGQREVGDGGR